jgi:phosphatidylglycerophosphatase A
VRGEPRLGLPFRHPAVIIATGLGTGLLPVTPGSWGSLLALPIGWAIVAAAGKIGLAVAVLCALALGTWAANRVIEESGLHDPGAIVVDEVVGQWIVLLAAPQRFWTYALAFLFFRLFDILKPWPVGWADRNVGGGFGVMLDDLLAAVYAVLVLLAVEAAAGGAP